MLYNWDHSEEELYDYLKPLIDPNQKGEAKGPQGARLSPEAVSHLIIARTTAIDAIAHGKQIPDSLWEWARAFYLFTFQQYEQQRPIFAAQTAETTVAHLFQANDLSSLYSTACFELATVLGVGLLNPAPLHLPIYWQPQTWERQKMTARVTSKPIPSSLLGPDGRPLMHLQVEVSINLLNECENRTDWPS